MFYTNVYQWGDNLLVRAIENGKRVSKRVRYEPTLFVPVRKQTSFTTLDGKFLTPMKFTSIKEAKEFVEQYKDQSHLVFGHTQYAYTYIADKYPEDIKWELDKLLLITIDIEVECENGFPNARQAIEPLLSITVKNHQTQKIVVWGLNNFTTDRDDITYVQCKDEKHLLEEFMVFWEQNTPDIVTGWNIDFFDIPYLMNRIKHLFGEDKLKVFSPWGNVSDKEVYMMGRKHQMYDILGVAILDYLELYRKFTYTSQENYRLDHIASVELGEQKHENPYETFKEWYTKDYQSFIEYNIADVELVDKLEDRLKLIELLITMAYDCKVNYSDMLGSVKYWDILIYNYLRKKNIIVPQKRKYSEKSHRYQGAYVKEPQVGLHNWVVGLDLNSLYPHLIMQYGISPETMIEEKDIQKRIDASKSSQEIADLEKLLELKHNASVENFLGKKLDTTVLQKLGITMTPNGAMYRITGRRGFLPELMEKIYTDRVIYKRKALNASQLYEDTKDKKYLNDISRYHTKQLAQKISLNSAYGAIGNEWFRYYDIRNAEAITTSGQLAIRWIEKKMNEYLNELFDTDDADYIIASDTDSIYVTFDKLISRVFKEDVSPTKIITFLDKITKEKIEPFIDKSYEELAKYLNVYEHKMVMKREIIADKGIWTAKKRYILNVWDNEGVRYKEPHLKIMGIEAVKSSTPASCREKIKEALKLIMTGNEKELNKFIQDFRKEFLKLPPEDIAYPRSVNGVSKFMDSNALYKKGTPIHVKGAILYNHLLKKNKLINKYPIIQDGDKIKFFPLRQPNIYQSNVMSFFTKMPKEFEIDDIIDYDTQFDKAFVEPLNFVIERIGWKVDRSYGTQLSLEDFFA
ncbi:MAG: DNA polymerase [Candidatus Neomarinimicrobiota bacterium]|nr:MAG: DNA polymerase [Candidatus Neomarinimicrobiota bacterium]